MRNLIAISGLLFAVLLGSTDVSWATASNTNTKAENAIECAALYFIASSLTENNDKAAKNLGQLQEVFQAVYGATKLERTGQTITNGMISKAKSSYMVRLGKQYDRNPDQVYTREIRCDAWRAIIAVALSKLNSRSSQADVARTIRNLPEMPSAPSRSDPRWSNSKALVDASFKKWTENGRITPQSARDALRRSSN